MNKPIHVWLPEKVKQEWKLNVAKEGKGETQQSVFLRLILRYNEGKRG